MKNPFPGLRPFYSDEYHLFFGRETHIVEIIRKLETARFVSVVGNSGSGKSSLVRAGVLPALMKDEKANWIICTMRPGQLPVEELNLALLSQLSTKADPVIQIDVEKNLEVLKKSKKGLIQVVRPFLAEGSRLLILIDQFEELFRYSEFHNSLDFNAGPQHFIDLILESIGQTDIPIYAMITVRSDFLGDCEKFDGLPEAINEGQFLVPRLKAHELEKTIQGPIDMVDGKIALRLIKQLVNQVGNNPDQLPILQHNLNRVWEVWKVEDKPNSPIDLSHYEKTGGMEQAMSIHAEEAFAELTSERQKYIAEQMFKTITVKGPDNRGIRRPTSVSEICKIIVAKPEEVIEIANIFRRNDRGFIMPSDQVKLTETSILDISHESLMRVWKRLIEWVREESESAEMYQRITDSAILFDRNMSGLWRDPDLQLAIDWRRNVQSNIHWANQYNEQYSLTLRFLELSIQQSHFEKKDAIRKKRLLTGMVSVFIVILTGLSIWAVLERSKSVESAKIANGEKSKAEIQQKIALGESIRAEKNEKFAVQQQKIAEAQKFETEIQKNNALENSKKAEVEKNKAEIASVEAIRAKRAAEIDKHNALIAKGTSDSLRIVSVKAEKTATRLRMLAVGQNLTSKSKLLDSKSENVNIKANLALESYRIMEKNKGNVDDPDLYEALIGSLNLFLQKPQYTHSLHNDAVKSVEVVKYRDTNWLLSAGSDGLLTMSVIGNFSRLMQSPKFPNIFDNLVVSDDNSRFAVNNEQHSILIFKVGQLAAKPEIISSIHAGSITSMFWVKNHLFTVGLDMKINEIDLATKKVVNTFLLPSRPLCADIDRSSRNMVVGCEDGGLYLVDLAMNGIAKAVSRKVSGRVTSIRFLPKGNRIVFGTDKGSCNIIHLDGSTDEKYILLGHEALISQIKINEKYNLIVTSSYDGVVRLYDLNNVEDRAIVLTDHQSWVNDFVFTDDFNSVVSGGKDNKIFLRPASTLVAYKALMPFVKNGLTTAEWEKWVGKDIPMQSNE